MITELFRYVSVLRPRRHKRKSNENRRFRRKGVSLAQNFRYKGQGSSDANHSFCQKSWMVLLCGYKNLGSRLFSFVTMHARTDGRTDRQISTARPCVSIRTVETEANVVVSECTATACHRVSCIKFCVIYTFYTQHAQKKPACYGAERARMYSTNDKANIIGVARGCTGCTRTPRAEKNGAKFTAESCNCTPRQRVHPLQKSNFWGNWETWAVEEVI